MAYFSALAFFLPAFALTCEARMAPIPDTRYLKTIGTTITAQTRMAVFRAALMLRPRRSSLSYGWARR